MPSDLREHSVRAANQPSPLSAVTRAGFDAQRGRYGALLIGSPDEVIEKIARHGEALGGVSRFTFQMNAASLPNAKLMQAIEILGTRVAPELRKELAAANSEKREQAIERISNVTQ